MRYHAHVIIVIDPVSSARQYGPEIRRKGYYAVALVTRERFPGRLHNLHCVDGFDEVIRVSDLADAQAKLQGVAVRAIIPGSDSALKISDKLADHFFVVGNPVATCLSRLNKWEMKKRLISKGINATPSFKITLDELIEGAEFDIPFPMVVKPCQGTGSKNVKICNSRGDVYRALAAIESAGESYIAEEKFALMEEYIDGQEYFIATANLGKNLSRQILCFAEYEKIRVGNNPSVYKNIRSVSPLSEMALNAFSYVEQVNHALEANIGINDIEFKINSKGVFIIEQNGRLPGANVPSLIELCTGINLYDLNIDLFLGVPPLYVHAPEYHKHFCICCLISYKGGNLKKIDGLEFVTELESFQQVNLLVTEGDIVEPTEDFLSSWGFVYLAHENPEVLKLHSDIVHEKMKLLYF